MKVQNFETAVSHHHDSVTTMSNSKYLLIGGLVAMGFDPSGEFLLTISHTGSGVFRVGTWEKLARDSATAYPIAGKAQGIGPLDGHVIEVAERDETRDKIEISSPDGKIHLLGEADGITIE